jgi:hypothetical protein
MLGAVEQPLRYPLFREGNLLSRLKDAVHSAAKMLHEAQGHASVLSEPAASETNPASQHELRLGSDVRIYRADSLIVWGDSSGVV